MQDSLDREQTAYNLSGEYYSNNTKHAVQNLYRQQLDELLQQKNKQRQYQRNKDIAQKRQFNERAKMNKQSERIKEQAYKNYYNMLLNNQEQLQSSYVSPYSVRDNLKDDHIKYSVEEGEKRMRQWEMEERRRDQIKKDMYKNELMHQLEQRKRMEMMTKQEEARKKEQFRKYGKIPSEIEQYERKRHLEEMAKYKQDLDKVKNQKQYFRQRTMSEQQNLKMVSGDYHNPLINPMPYNIQNPYILKEMNKQSYLASRGSHNFYNQGGSR